MQILVVGGGGREHALVWALRRELPEATLFAAPGNPGIASLATCLPLAANDLAGIVAAAKARAVDLVVVGPEQPLADGLADRLRAEGIAVFGPGAKAAQIEASKAFAKEVMTAAKVPTAPYAKFTDLSEALLYVDRHAEPLVVKASGLAAGKGAVVCSTRAEARQAVQEMMGDHRFGSAGDTVVIEGFLVGEELSVFAVTNGREVRILPPAQDHKRLGEGDVGPNTGGMGAYAPVSLTTPALLQRVENEVLLPTLRELEKRGAPFQGLLYAGLMVGPDGTPWVIEFNCRFGDPETQAVLPLLESGLADLLLAAAKGDPLPPIRPSAHAAVTTVLAAEGYPDAPKKGAPISIPEQLPAGVTVFHAGTTLSDGMLVASGGRVLTVTAVAPTFREAQARSKLACEMIAFPGKVWRRDIGWREAARLR
ncbi:MAG TPA: phosphoribosylamine--glycine ligase [Gemmatimonadales bacterium]|nr:phosphoribosylamine--glycine ligase [Gemmatimonadales bacterium]